MRRIALLLEYSGKSFHGSQLQLGVRTVQSELEKALSTFLRQPVRVTFSGRTDTGVHAGGQVAHFDLAADALDLWRFCWGVNGILPDDISINKAEVVEGSFHARFSAVKREYVYRILNRPQRSVLLKDNHLFIPRQLSLDSMKEANSAILGVHNFVAFRSANEYRGTAVCNVTRAEIFNLGEGQLEFWIAADHFVYNMVRIVAGTLVEIGLGKKAPESLAKALVSGDRNLAGPTAPPWGLTLNSVEYPEAYKLFESNSST